MEPMLQCSLIFVFLLYLVTTLLVAVGRRPPNSGRRLPPGPWQLPVIGSIHHLLGSRLPHHALRDRAKAHGPLMYLKLGEVPTIVVSSGDVAREMMKTHDATFSSRPRFRAVDVMFDGATDLVFAPYGEYWRQMRRICVHELLSASRVLSFRPVREDESAKLVRDVRSGAGHLPVNLSTMLYSYTNNLLSRVAFGDRCGDADMYLSAIKEASALVGGFGIADMFPSWPALARLAGVDAKVERCYQKVDKIIAGIIRGHVDHKVAANHENVLDVLLHLQAAGSGVEYPLTGAHIKAIILDLFVAGSGTSASAMIWAMSELMRNPSAMKKAQQEVRELASKVKRMIIREQDVVEELSYLKMVMMETLRLHPPAPLLVPRESTTSSNVCGYEVPAKAKVIFNGWAIGRDPARWDDAESFKPERFEGAPSSMNFRSVDDGFDFIPFGGGRRMCPGIEFGLASMELPLALLLYHFDWALPDGVVELNMMETSGLGARRKFDLCLRATPHVS